MRFALRPLRVDPIVVPKSALTGAPTERVDTRVMRVLYDVETNGRALYPGQQMDMYITATGEVATTALKESDNP